jgi:DNA recombination protein RmuC
MQLGLQEVLLCVVCFVVGALLGHLRASGAAAPAEARASAAIEQMKAADQRAAALEAARAETENRLSDHRDRLARATAETARLTATLEERTHFLGELSAEKARDAARYDTQLAKLHDDLGAAQRELARLKAEREVVTTAADERAAHARDMQQALKTEIGALSEQLFKRKAQEFTDVNQAMLGSLLGPLRERITEFTSSVQKNHDVDVAQHAVLRTELSRMQLLNAQLHDEATKLAKALTTQPRTRGAWGEMTLARVLEKSGLTSPENYSLQFTGVVDTDAGPQRYRPDAVIHLPEGRNLIVDSKVSLNDFLAFCDLEEGEARQSALGRHIQSMRRHFESLSDKGYPQIEGLGAPDFVFMFVPIEGAFITALQHDLDLFNQAFLKNIVIVSPSTRLASLRTVANVWRVENQNRNAKEIAQQAGRLYDKFVGFVGDLESVGKHLGKAQDAYGDAHRKLTSGRGPLTTQAERLRELGAESPKGKRIARTLLVDDESSDNDQSPAPGAPAEPASTGA